MKRDVRSATEVDAFVGARLKTLRKSEKMSQTELATQVGVTFQQIQKYERGSNRIGASRLWEFCKVFDVEPGRFFEGVEAHLSAKATLKDALNDSEHFETPSLSQVNMAMSSE